MSATNDILTILADAARERAEESVRWYASLTPAQKCWYEAREVAFLRRWKGMTGPERAAHIRRQISGEL